MPISIQADERVALLRLFNAVKIDGREDKGIPSYVIARGIKNGYVLQPEIAPDEEILQAIEKVIGISGEKANSAFHKRAMTLIGKVVDEGKEAAEEWRKKFKKAKLDRALRGQ